MRAAACARKSVAGSAGIAGEIPKNGKRVFANQCAISLRMNSARAAATLLDISPTSSVTGSKGSCSGSSTRIQGIDHINVLMMRNDPRRYPRKIAFDVRVERPIEECEREDLVTMVPSCALLPEHALESRTGFPEVMQSTSQSCAVP